MKGKNTKLKINKKTNIVCHKKYIIIGCKDAILYYHALNYVLLSMVMVL